MLTAPQTFDGRERLMDVGLYQFLGHGPLETSPDDAGALVHGAATPALADHGALQSLQRLRAEVTEWLHHPKAGNRNVRFQRGLYQWAVQDLNL